MSELYIVLEEFISCSYIVILQQLVC